MQHIRTKIILSQGKVHKISKRFHNWFHRQLSNECTYKTFLCIVNLKALYSHKPVTFALEVKLEPTQTYLLNELAKSPAIHLLAVDRLEMTVNNDFLKTFLSELSFLKAQFQLSIIQRSYIDIQMLLRHPFTSVRTAINLQMTVNTLLEHNSPEPLTLWENGVNIPAKLPSTARVGVKTTTKVTIEISI